MPENNHKPPEKKEVQKNSSVADLISGDLDKDKCEIIERILQLHIGPLPPPQTLEGYNKLLPNATERIFQMAEKSQKHFHEKEKYLIESERKKIDKGQNFALVVSVVALVGAVLCAAFHEPVVGTVIGGSTLVAVVANFLSARSKRDGVDVEETIDDSENNEKENAVSQSEKE
ncbi:MAG: DUF2335 domain-containing protein [Candidatus Aminicenantes bacterium]|jgi:uncharacterized membrane protein